MAIPRARRRATPPLLNLVYLADVRFPLERANGIQTMETCWALAARGHEVDLVVRDDRHRPQRDPFDYYGLATLRQLVIHHVPLARTRVPASVNRFEYLFAAARTVFFGAAFDIVMTRDLGVASLLLRLNRNVPLVYESHGYAPEVAAALPKMLSTARPPSRAKIDRLARREARVWRDAAGYATITAGLADDLRRRFGDRGRLVVIPDGVRLPDESVRLKPDTPTERHVRLKPDTTAVASGVSRTRDGIVVGYAGHLYTWKGVDVLLEALAHMSNVRGLIVGGHQHEPDLARARALASTLRIGDRVTFTGQVAHADVPALLAATDILVLPNPASAISTHATSPLKLFEYMAAGRAIVASDLPSIREVLTDGATALLVAPGDARAMAAAIDRLAADPSLRTRLGTAAHAAAADYSWTRRAERLEGLFRQVLDARLATGQRR
jgi:glycosyltransferase involved in cell wall biosynthesis